MKVDQFAVSVQWGGGFHYFQKYCPTYAEAQELANRLSVALDSDRKRKKHKGAEPLVHVWRLESSGLTAYER